MTDRHTVGKRFFDSVERLREDLDSLLARLANEPEVRDRLKSLVSVYPFNEYEYVIANLLAMDVLDLDGYLEAGRVAGQDPNLGGCSRSTRHHVPFGERSGAERAVMSGS